jgi:hypothetical protein
MRMLPGEEAAIRGFGTAGSERRRMLKALAEGETDPAALASLADHRPRASQEQITGCAGSL